MEAILKKAKITSSILKQSMSVVALENFKDMESIGWVLHNKEKWLVFHKDGIIKMLVHGSVLSLKDDWEQIDDTGNRQKFFYVTVKRSNRYDQNFKFKSQQEATDYKDKYEDKMKECKDKGQFYI